MQRVLIVISHADDAAAQEATNACKHLAQRGIACAFDKDDLDHFAALGVTQPEGSKTYSGENLDLVMVLGGDGSILRAAEIVNDNPAPILGINLGHVGFMTEAERSEIPAVLDAVAAGNFSTSERTTLEVRCGKRAKRCSPVGQLMRLPWRRALASECSRLCSRLTQDPYRALVAMEF